MYTQTDLENIENEIRRLKVLRHTMISELGAQEGEKLATADDFIKQFKMVNALEITEDTVVCYQGVPGAYSHQAMHSFFGKDIKNINVPKFEDVIEAVKRGDADYGVLPIENSSAGFVNGIYDMVGASDLTVVGENEVKVAHALLGVPGAKESDIQKVYSHPQGLMQCSDYISAAGYEKEPLTNTAVSAMKVKEDGDKTQAAIASTLAAEIYGLEILNSDIVNNKNNTTRFLILTRGKICVKSSENLVIRFSLPHESGTLYNILTHINMHGINMTSIESRPLQGKKWEYAFFITLDGSLRDKATQECLKGMYTESINFDIIGTY